eukprot:scaffold46026_cov36-Tisochrysis_lutea.AAC.2
MSPTIAASFRECRSDRPFTRLNSLASSVRSPKNHPLLAHTMGQHVANIIPRVTIQPLLQSLLVKKVADEADRTTEDKEAIEDA